MDSSDNFGLKKLFISFTPIFEAETMFRGSVIYKRKYILTSRKTLINFCLMRALASLTEKRLFPRVFNFVISKKQLFFICFSYCIRICLSSLVKNLRFLVKSPRSSDSHLVLTNKMDIYIYIYILGADSVLSAFFCLCSNNSCSIFKKLAPHCSF